MKHVMARFRFPRRPQSVTQTLITLSATALVALLLLVGATSTAVAQGYGRVIYEEELDAEPPVRPYILGYVGMGDPVDDAYKEVFSDPYFRIGGGFGMRFGSFGAEVILRQGSVKETHLVPIQTIGTEEFRTFSFGTTEVQARFYVTPNVGPVRLPAGLGIGIMNMTVDRGFPGVYDRFGSGDVFISPFLGVEYEVNSSLAVGLEVEYTSGDVTFNQSQVWVDQYGSINHGQIGHGESFWDTVGGSDKNVFESGGLVLSMRAVIYIPTYRGNN
ncbi:porin family protein [bacterium]|nr:porin family protein [bacterium]